MDYGMHEWTQLPIEQLQRGNRIDAVGLPAQFNPFHEGPVGIKDASATCRSIAEGIEGKSAGATGNASAAARKTSSTALPCDEDFYEIFSEIRLS